MTAPTPDPTPASQVRAGACPRPSRHGRPGASGTHPGSNRSTDRMSNLARTLTLIAAAAAIAGCGIANPYQHAATSSTSTSASTARSTATNPAQNPGEPPTSPPPAPASQAPASLQSTPAGAITQFATLYINWTWRTLAAHERGL